MDPGSSKGGDPWLAGQDGEGRAEGQACAQAEAAGLHTSEGARWTPPGTEAIQTSRAEIRPLGSPHLSDQTKGPFSRASWRGAGLWETPRHLCPGWTHCRTLGPAAHSSPPPQEALGRLGAWRPAASGHHGFISLGDPQLLTGGSPDVAGGAAGPQGQQQPQVPPAQLLRRPHLLHGEGRSVRVGSGP